MNMFSAKNIVTVETLQILSCH